MNVLALSGSRCMPPVEPDENPRLRTSKVLKYVLTSVLGRSFSLTAERGSTTLSELKNIGASIVHILWLDLGF
jgi:hypothetical protein